MNHLVCTMTLTLKVKILFVFWGCLCGCTFQTKFPTTNNNFVRYAYFCAFAPLIYDLFVENISTSRIYDYIPI